MPGNQTGTAGGFFDRRAREIEMDGTFTARLGHPFYRDRVLYVAYDRWPGLPILRAWEFAGWPKESLSWRNGCYIHGGLSGNGPISIRGPEAKKYLQSILINSLEKFPVGSMKHAVMCTEDGLVAAHGIVERKADDHFEVFRLDRSISELDSGGVTVRRPVWCPCRTLLDIVR